MNKNFFIVTKGFQLTGKVEFVLVAERRDSHVSISIPSIDVFTSKGIRYEKHWGRTRLADVREKALLGIGLPKRIEVANDRQWSATSVEEMDALAALLKIQHIPPGILGENLIISGIPEFSMLPIGTKLFFKHEEEDKPPALLPTILNVSGTNNPCSIPAKALQNIYKTVPGVEKFFNKHAMYRRGLVGSVYCSGRISAGDTVIACIPDQYLYQRQ